MHDATRLHDADHSSAHLSYAQLFAAHNFLKQIVLPSGWWARWLCPVEACNCHWLWLEAGCQAAVIDTCTASR